MIIKLYEMPVMSKEEALLKINEYFVENEITDQSYYEGILLREKQAPFYIGNYIAIPHALFEYTKHIKQNGLIILRFINPIDWDNNKVHYVIGIAVTGDKHIDVLSNIANSFCEAELTISSLKINLDILVKQLEWE